MLCAQYLVDKINISNNKLQLWNFNKYILKLLKIPMIWGCWTIFSSTHTITTTRIQLGEKLQFDWRDINVRQKLLLYKSEEIMKATTYLWDVL